MSLFEETALCLVPLPCPYVLLSLCLVVPLAAVDKCPQGQSGSEELSWLHLLLREAIFPGFHFFPDLFPRDDLRMKVFPEDSSEDSSGDPPEASALSFSTGAVYVKSGTLVSSGERGVSSNEIAAGCAETDTSSRGSVAFSTGTAVSSTGSGAFSTGAAASSADSGAFSIEAAISSAGSGAFSTGIAASSTCTGTFSTGVCRRSRILFLLPRGSGGSQTDGGGPVCVPPCKRYGSYACRVQCGRYPDPLPGG